MNRLWNCVLIAVFACVGASAQTTGTMSGGTTYNIPAFNGVASIAGSPIYVSDGNVGIGTSFYNLYNPADPSARSPQMYIDGDVGNVGIGTITPAEKLEVSGNIVFTDG